MTTRIADILTRARDSLADPNKERWSDDRLLRLLDEGQKHFAREAKLLKATSIVNLFPDQATYTLPSDCWLITRACFKDLVIPLTSHERMDELNTNWYTETGSAVERLIFDNRLPEEIRTYPIVDDSYVESSYTFDNAGYLDTVIYTGDAFGVITEAEDELGIVADTYGVATDFQFVDYIVTDVNSCNGISLVTDGVVESEYGVFTDIVDNIRVVSFHEGAALGVTVAIDDFTEDSPYGIVSGLYSPDITSENFLSTYGVISDISEATGVLQLFYIRDPASIKYIDDELEIAYRWDTAMKFYIVGHALRDDLDASFRTLGNENLQFYNRELALAKKSDSTDSTRATQYEISYRSPFQ